MAVTVGAGAAAGEEIAFTGAQWEERSPQSQGIDPEKLTAAVRYLEENAGSDGVKELVIVRNGHMVWKGTDIDKVHGVWSCTKSFVSTVLGLLIEDGKCRLESRAKEFLPALSEHYPEVTLRHFTTMTSGYRAMGDEPDGSYIHGPSKTPFTPSLEPLFAPPGSSFAYWDSAMNQFAHVLTRIAGEPLKALFKRRIADPIGMNPEAWDWGDFGKVDGLEVNGGAGNHAKYVRISAREMARFGHLFLNQGRWKDHQLIRADWVKAATSPQVPATVSLKGAKINGCGVYGYNWWVNGQKPDGRRQWPGAPPGTFSASGFNNNDLFVIPEWRMVVVRLGLDQNEREITTATYNAFLTKLGETIRASS
jgi:CubicO group peptidase (beta-lactamase class C family)